MGEGMASGQGRANAHRLFAMGRGPEGPLFH